MGLHASLDTIAATTSFPTSEPSDGSQGQWGPFDRHPSGKDPTCWLGQNMPPVQNVRAMAEVLEAMDRCGVRPDSEIYASMLRSCTSLSSGQRLHRHIVANGYGSNVFVSNLLVDMYGKCGSSDEAKQVFDTMPKRNLYSWNLLLSALSSSMHSLYLQGVFHRMPNHGSVASNVMITAHAETGHLHQSKILFDSLPDCNVVSGNAMLQGYMDNGRLGEAQAMFDGMPERDLISWNALVQGYASTGHLRTARNLLTLMPACSVISWTGMMNEYARFRKIREARELFDEMLERNTVSWNALLQAYTQNGHLQDAKALLDRMPYHDVVSWTVMLTGFGSCGKLEQAKELFGSMPEHSDVSWNSLTAAYAREGYMREAKELFDTGVRLKNLVSWNTMLQAYTQNDRLEDAVTTFQKMPGRDVVSWTTMVGAYAQGGHIERARESFDTMPCKNLVTWNAIMAGYIHNGDSRAGLTLFRLMDLEGVKPDEVSYVLALDACANIPSLADGELIHQLCHLSLGAHCNVEVGNALLNMYAKCGKIDSARQVFAVMGDHDIVSWNTVLAACAQKGSAEQTTELFHLMSFHGIEPDGITFLSLLSSCSHAGLKALAREHFWSFVRDHWLVPQMEHYMCMVDVLARAGEVGGAEELVSVMPFEPSSVAWSAILGACKHHGETGIGEEAAAHFLRLDPDTSAPFAVLPSIRSW